MRRTPLKRSTKPIRKVSKKRGKQMRVYSLVRRAYLEDCPTCEVCRATQATDIHHKAGRIGALLVDETKFLATCRPCHERIHRQPSWARANGFMT